jgi:hypothetical protein
VVKQLMADGLAPESDLVRSVYAGLHRFERKGLLKADRRQLTRRRITVKCYRVAAAGARRLRTPQPAAAGTVVPEFNPVTWLVVMAVIGSGSTLAARGHNRRPHVTIFVEPLDEQREDRATALARLKAGIASMQFYSNGRLPTRAELHDRP